MTRRGLGAAPPWGRIAVLVQALAALAFVAVLLGAEGVRLPFTGGGTWSVHAVFADAAGIRGGERIPVLVSGVPEGEVSGVRVQSGLALVTLRLPDSARGVIRRDATAQIEPRSALEDLSINVRPGSRAVPAAAPGMTIPVAQTAGMTTLDRLTSILDADTRAQVAVLLSGLATGLRGHGGVLTAALARLRATLDPARAVAGALARRRALLTRLVDALARVGGVAAAHDASIAQALAAGAATLQVTAREQASIARTVAGLPGAVADTAGALHGVSALATPLDQLLSGLVATARALPGALSAVRAAAPPLSRLLATAGGFARGAARPLHDAADALSQLGSVAGPLTPAISAVQPIVSAVNDRRDGIGLLGERFSGVLSTNDANGPILRGLGTFEPFNPADFGYPSSLGGAQRALVATRAAQALTLACTDGSLVACLVRYLVPGLPGSVR